MQYRCGVNRIMSRQTQKEWTGGIMTVKQRPSRFVPAWIKPFLPQPPPSKPARKPANISYSVDEKPPVWLAIIAAVQLISVTSVTALYPALIGQQAGLDQAAITGMIAVSFIAMAVGTGLQALRPGIVGCGYLLPTNFSSAYLPANLLALHLGGLPLVFGMTCVSGLAIGLFARMLPHLRAMFPPEVAGLIVLLLGLALGGLGFQLCLSDAAGNPAALQQIMLAGITLTIIAGFNVWTTGMLRIQATLIGIVTGYLIAIVLGDFPADLGQRLAATPIVAVPAVRFGGLGFDVSLLGPYLVSALAGSMITIGNVVTVQKINDADWVRPDAESISGGVFADGMSSAIAALLGTIGMSTSASGTGLAGAIGITSRRLAFTQSALLLVLGCMPSFALLLGAMPRPVTGAVLVFIACFILVNGIQIIASRLLDARRTLVLGVSLTLGLTTEVHPALFASLPSALKPLAASPMLLGTVAALALNLVLRIGVRRTLCLEIAPDMLPADLENRLITQGAVWGARQDVTRQAVFGVSQSVEIVRENCDPIGPIRLDASFDETRLDVSLTYRGIPLALPERRPTDDEIMSSEDGHLLLAGYMLRRNADRVQISRQNNETSISFRFNH